jgi:hypothetical protein
LSTEWEQKRTRLQTDFDNFKASHVNQTLEAQLDVRIEVLKQFLPVLDNFDRARASIRSEGAAQEATNALYTQMHTGLMATLGELGMKKIEAVGTEYGKQMFDTVLLENYGHAGPIYLRHIISKLPEVLAKLKDTQTKIDRELKLLPRERFWSATIAANLVGAIYAKECGLLTWDLKRIYLWVCRQLEVMRGEAEAPLDDVEQILGDYLYRSIQNILVIDDGDARSKAKPLPKREPKGELLVRIEPNTKMMYVSVKQFKEYCVRFQISYAETTRKLKEGGRLLKSKTYRMTKGTNITVDGVHCLWLKIDEDLLDLDMYIDPDED